LDRVSFEPARLTSRRCESWPPSTDADERFHADAMVAIAEARRLLSLRGATDWLRPLADFRRGLGQCGGWNRLA
jgi:hypothetical protein